MSKMIDKLIPVCILIVLIKTISSPTPTMIVLSFIFVLTYIQDKYIEDKTINNTISLFAGGITLIVACMTSVPLFRGLICLYTSTLLAIIAVKNRRHNIKDWGN